MNAVEIEEAISALAEQPFDRDEFPFAFLQAFGNKPTTIKRLRAGSSNKSDQGGVLQTNNVHLKVCAEGEVTKTLAQLKVSPATTKAFGQIMKTLFILRYIDDLELRQSIEAQLNKVELANRFTRAIAVGNPREYTQGAKEDPPLLSARAKVSGEAPLRVPFQNPWGLFMGSC